MSLPSAIVLAGGFGTRLPEVSATRPKPMADVCGRPFLEYVLDHLRACGIERVVLSTGYKGEVIERHFGDGSAFGLRISCVRELEPLGTAGALGLTLPQIGERAFVLNGDSFADVDMAALAAFHRACQAAFTLVATPREDASRFGRVVAAAGRIEAFEEKRAGREPGLINAGVYLIERRILENIPAGRPSSLEKDLLPLLLARNEHVAVFEHRGQFEDIGVPEGLAAFRAAAGRWRRQRMSGAIDSVRSELAESIAVKGRWDDDLCAGVVELSERIVAALRKRGKVILFGNGGSAADAQHIAAELVGRYGREREPLRAIALTTNSSAITAIANDYDYEVVFQRQLEAWADEGDVVIGITTSGNSANVLRALEQARKRRCFTAALTGEGGGRVREVCDLLLAIPSRSTPRIQESHITLGHILCGLVERAMCEVT